MECCYKFVYAGTINEFHHGPKALLETDIPVILIAPEASDGFSLASDYINAAKFLKSLKVCLISLTDIDEVAALSDLSFRLPKAADGNEAVFSALAVQKLVLALALSLELNPDAPRNLKKITITK
jgi:glucosamine--fructose-6-phosphate aminotransferase (isomerizing)